MTNPAQPPPLIARPVDSNSEDHLRNCLAWHLLSRRTRTEVQEWLKQQPEVLRSDMRVRLNRLREQVKAMREVARP
ncbi:hypothetical protein [Microbulbifer discodermiae]|uniref:hypothetical protein n=1 Tax=Microbulbifer sp. 2201CG32-9 TaxID=3232309 RepID=UPI00345B7403